MGAAKTTKALTMATRSRAWCAGSSIHWWGKKETWEVWRPWSRRRTTCRWYTGGAAAYKVPWLRLAAGVMATSEGLDQACREPTRQAPTTRGPDNICPYTDTQMETTNLEWWRVEKRLPAPKSIDCGRKHCFPALQTNSSACSSASAFCWL